MRQQPMRLYVIRHARTAWNHSGKAQGHTDIPLDDVGQQQAAALGKAFRHGDAHRIISSDLQRCLQTGAPVAEALSLEMEVQPCLRERSFGDFEGMDYEEVGNKLNELRHQHGTDQLRTRPPNGESFEDLWQRTQPFAESLFEIEQDTVVVTHGGTASVLMAQLLRGSLETLRAFRFGNTAICELQRRPDGTFLLIRYSDQTHLNGLGDSPSIRELDAKSTIR